MNWNWNEYFILLSPSLCSLHLSLSLSVPDKPSSAQTSASAFRWDVLRPWLQPQSQPLTPTETNHRSRLPSSHCSPVLTTRQLNLRFSTVEISLAIQSCSLPFITPLHSPSSFISQHSFSRTHGITSFLASPVQLFDVSASDLHFADPSSFLLFSICSFLLITTKT